MLHTFQLVIYLISEYTSNAKMTSNNTTQTMTSRFLSDKLRAAFDSLQKPLENEKIDRQRYFTSVPSHFTIMSGRDIDISSLPEAKHRTVRSGVIPFLTFQSTPVFCFVRHIKQDLSDFAGYCERSESFV